PDNKGAKAGNLNNALSKTSAPYVVTFDADMIPKSDFLLKTIPYFADAELKNRGLPEEEQIHLGLLQTPQCFYDPDVFQHALYSEKRAPNEQDFFYRTIEPAKTSTNSVIYGGSNTVLLRRALEDIGGFYTESITEDFATGLLIESAGYVSLALPEPLASGQTPHTFREHIKQRTRWGRGVIVTARKLKIWRRRSLSLSQKVSYWSSVIYWYSPIKNLIYVLSPLLFAVFAIPVFKCSWLELLVFWLPMFVLQDVCLRVTSNKTISQKWSGIYETSVMPHLLIPIIKESMGITMSAFKVTDKSRSGGKRQSDFRSMIPFIVLAALSVIGILRIIAVFDRMQAIGFLILLFWIVRNLYFLILAIFLVDGRDSDGDTVSVIDAMPVTVETERGDVQKYEGVTTRLTEHNLTVFLDEGESLGIGEAVRISVDSGEHRSQLRGVVTGITESRRSSARTQTVDILDFGDSEYEYWEILYDRIPTLPQSLTRDFGILAHLWQNIAHRVARTRK
ncbi:MAG: glycosyltransferase, partial [Oscillospiraceae bacterium]|nr:glycosyltransferase [Oscillospiraceae bacterium]